MGCGARAGGVLQHLKNSTGTYHKMHTFPTATPVEKSSFFARFHLTAGREYT